jgi:fatty acid desaturase
MTQSKPCPNHFKSKAFKLQQTQLVEVTMNTNCESGQEGRTYEHNLPRIATPPRLNKKMLQALSQVNPYISSCHILFEWTAIMLTATICQHFWNPLLYLASIVIIGARQHALLVLMHDGTHYRLFRNRQVNDWITEILLAWPHLVTMRSYRENHLAHHNYVNTDKDPDWRRKKDNPEWHFPQSVKSLLGIFVRDLIGIGGIKLIRLASSLKASARKPDKAFSRLRLAFYVVVVGGLVAVGWGKDLVLYWIVPFFTWLVLVMRVRSIAEHFAIENRSGIYRQTRTTQAGLLTRMFLAPKNVNYHIEHHFFPSVPFYRLPELHSLLMATPEFALGAHITGSYGKVLLECMGRASRLKGSTAILNSEMALPAVANS